MKSTITSHEQARRITSRISHKGAHDALTALLMGVPMLDALNIAKRDNAWYALRDKQLKSIKTEVSIAEAMAKDTIRLHVRIGKKWSTTIVTPERAVKYAERAFSDGASEIKVY